ncbi:hypothetical protein [Leucobacter luti]|uniref:hypothetical protein n=1 Tax=Leucobacter luti TaxID=340320 RepID=UPI0018E55A2F|nr:hypothetical protein [Leucobacter luti]
MRGRTAPLFAVLALAAGVAGLSACAPEPAPTPTPIATQTPAPTPTQTPTSTPTPTAIPWERFSDERLTQSFELPPGWTVQELGGPNDMGIVQLGVLDPTGAQRLVFMNAVQGLGGACGELPQQAIEELDACPVEIPGYVAAPDGVTELVAPRVVFRAAPVAEGALASLALADDVPPLSCMYVNLLHTSGGLTAFGTALQVDTYDPQSQWLFGSMDEARAYTQTDDYAQLVRILQSFRIA